MGQGKVNVPWRIETYGIDVVPDAERHGRPIDLFWIWFAANIGILAIPYGTIILSFGLNFFQGLAVAIIGVLFSFMLVGAFSVAGRDAGAPMFTLSRAVFGLRGNFFPNFVSWISMVGWESIAVILGTLAMMSLIGTYWHLATVPLGLISMVIVAGLVIVVGLLGQATLVIVQTWASYVFGALTLIVAVLLIPRTNWSQLVNQPAGPWLDGFVPALSIVMAGTGLSWANAAADYSRHTQKKYSAASVFWSATLGGAIPLLVLIVVGLFFATKEPQLGSASNPIALIQSALPAWMAVPYLLTAVAGLVVEADLSLYSSGLDLLNLGVPLERYKTVGIDAVIMLAATTYVVLIAQNFFSPFESFLLLLGVGLAAWEGIFLADQLFIRRRVGDYLSPVLYDRHATQGLTRQGWNVPAVAGWFVGVVLGLLTTVSPWFSGPWAVGVFASSSLELAVAFFGAAAVFLAWSLVALRQRRAGPAGRALRTTPGSTGA
ncbi:MAG: purine-cytosine permease family protein [Candidatus Limnocylindrales bacterium]